MEVKHSRSQTWPDREPASDRKTARAALGRCGDLTLNSSELLEKIAPHVLCRPGTLACLPCAAVERYSSCHTHHQPRVLHYSHSLPQSCRLVVLLDASRLPYQHDATAADCTRLRRSSHNGALERVCVRELRKSSRIKCALPVSLQIDSTRRRTLWVLASDVFGVECVCANERRVCFVDDPPTRPPTCVSCDDHSYHFLRCPAS